MAPNPLNIINTRPIIFIYSSWKPVGFFLVQKMLDITYSNEYLLEIPADWHGWSAINSHERLAASRVRGAVAWEAA
jgi:hypothetical protein